MVLRWRRIAAIFCSYHVVLVKCVDIHDVSFDWPIREGVSFDRPMREGGSCTTEEGFSL